MQKGQCKHTWHFLLIQTAWTKATENQLKTNSCRKQTLFCCHFQFSRRYEGFV